MDRAALVSRRDELQLEYNRANNHARELAGAVAAYEELIELIDQETAAKSAAKPVKGRKTDDGTS